MSRPPDYQRHLPHYTPNDAPYFITFNLHGGMPREVRQRILSEKRNFNRYDKYLDQVTSGPVWLKDPPTATIVQDRLLRLQDEIPTLHAFSIMSNHVHLLMTLDQGQKLEDIMQSIKGSTSRDCNLAIGRSGKFWQHESYDRVLRKNEGYSVVRYIINNPVRVGLTRSWKDYPFTYLNPELYPSYDEARSHLI